MDNEYANLKEYRTLPCGTVIRPTDDLIVYGRDENVVTVTIWGTPIIFDVQESELNYG